MVSNVSVALKGDCKEISTGLMQKILISFCPRGIGYVVVNI
jgi:hypothetical protein